MPIKDIKEKVSAQLKAETDPDRIKALSSIQDDLDKEQADEDKLIANNSKLLDLYKASITHEGTKETPPSPTITEAPTYDTILAQAIKASKDAGKEK